MIHSDGPLPQKSNDFETIPTGDVTEGNEESDWAAWQDSVAFQDSMISGFQGTMPVSSSMQLAGGPVPESSPVLAVEVIEGNDETVWAAWEESVHFQDSQMSAVEASATPPGSSPGETSTEHVDIF